MINNADQFSQPSLIIFTKGANNFDHYCMYVCIYIYNLNTKYWTDVLPFKTKSMN